MKICIYGAGAIGGYMGAQLARAGADVSFVARGPHLAAMQANGVRLQIDGEEHTVKVRCENGEVRLKLQADGDVRVARWAASRETELFRRAFARELTVQAA